MRLLPFGLLVFGIIAVVSSESNRAEITDRLIQETLLTPDGEDVNTEVLEHLVIKMFEADKTAKLMKQQNDPSNSPASMEKASTDALNNFLTVGKSPSTTPFLGLSTMCDICASVMTVAGRLVENPKVWAKIIDLAKQICPRVTGGFPQYVCDGYVNSFGDIVHYVMPYMLDSPYSMCNAVLKNLGCGQPDHQHTLWEIPLPAELPAPVPQATAAPSSKDRVRALLMTDIHIDPEYEVGSPARCLEPMCCRSTSTPVHDPLPDNERAGYWGDYRLCDLPKWTFEETLRQIKENHGSEIDVVFIAGDLPPHDTWNQSSATHMEIIDYISEKFADALPGKPVFFSVGNHESAPVNVYPLPQDPKKFSVQWLYDKLADTWMKWLDPDIANATIRYGGFYTTKLMPGWRLVSINDNFCLSQNFFMYQPNITDPYGHLKWLVDILTDAEAKGDRVQILGHIPPGNHDCMQAWSWNYYRIISRFAHIITGQFFGHIHKEYFIMYYDAETLTVPKSVAFVGPPGTPFSRNNIGYRIYDYNPQTYEMMDYHSWYVDVDEANANNDTTKMPWKLEYSALTEYSLPNMTAAAWSEFASNMQKNTALFNKYQNHYQVSIQDPKEPCGIECRRVRLCQAYEGLSRTQESFCEHFFPRAKQEENPNLRKCSARFIKRAD